jgi:plastocyanin
MKHLLVGVLAVALCATGAAARADNPTISLTIRKHQFEPAELQVPAGTKVKLVVKNTDPTPEEFESPDLKREKVIQGGSEATIYVGPLKAGRYEFFGEFNPKTARGFIIVN